MPAAAASLTNARDDVVGIVRVADGVRAAQQHLEEDVRDLLAELREPLPRVFLEEPHRRVERRPAPHLDREHLGAEPGVGVGHAEHVAGPHARRQQRLMGVAERRVGEQQRLLLADPAARTPPARASGTICREPSGGARGAVEARAARARPARRTPAGRATPGKPLTVTSAANVRSFVARSWRTGNRNSSGVSSMNRVVQLAGEELGVRDDVDQERDVRLHAADAELLQRPLHPPRGVDEPPAAGRDLHQQRVVERRDDRAR